MVSAQQDTNSLFLKSDTDRGTTPSEHRVHCTTVYPQMASAKVQLLSSSACFFNKDIEIGRLLKRSMVTGWEQWKNEVQEVKTGRHRERKRHLNPLYICLNQRPMQPFLSFHPFVSALPISSLSGHRSFS